MRLLNAAQMREADRQTIEDVGIASIVLMENAGRQVVGAIESTFDDLDRMRVAVLAEQMQRISRLAHRVIWVNPLKSAPGYKPLAAGMAAALPHVDVFLSGHNFESLEELARVISGVAGTDRENEGYRHIADA